MNIVTYVVLLPFLGALLAGIFKWAARWLAIIIALIVVTEAGLIFFGGPIGSALLGLRAEALSSGIFFMAACLTFLIIIFSGKYFEAGPRLNEYYGYTMLTLGSTAGVLFAADYLTLMVFWGMLAVALYMLIGLGGSGADRAAKKTLVIVGGADAFMLLGIGLIWVISRTLYIGYVPLPLDAPLNILAFVALLIGAFAKAGVMPLHSWIPDSATSAPLPVMALLPAALDKLLGVYLLFRLCTDIFVLEPGSALSLTLLAIGSVTIVLAVFGALVQHDFRKLLAFHAVSQVGYMVVGIGTGIPVGLAGGLFHMFNNAIYKSCLFLCAGAVEKKTGTMDLEKLGGLARLMPLTFIAFLVAALSISGLPPFNGFVSKWLIYQALVDFARISPTWIVWLTAALVGSAFTLASFMKLLHAIFLGQPGEASGKAKEVSWQMWLPTILLATTCVIFGVLAFTLPLHYLVLPAIDGFALTGIWQPVLATSLLLCGLFFGLVIYLCFLMKPVSVKPVFIGGEILPEESIKVSGVDFYDSIARLSLVSVFCRWGERRLFDAYELGGQLAWWLSRFFSRLHNGLLHTYLAWVFLGAIVLLLVLW